MKCYRCGSEYTLRKSKLPCGDCRKGARRAQKAIAKGEETAWLDEYAVRFATSLGRIGQAVVEGEALKTMLQQMRKGVGMPMIARLVRAPDSLPSRRLLGGGKTRIWYLFDIHGTLADQMLTDEQAYALASTEDAILRWPRGRRWAMGEMLPGRVSWAAPTPIRPRRSRSPGPPGVDTAA